MQVVRIGKSINLVTLSARFVEIHLSEAVMSWFRKALSLLLIVMLTSGSLTLPALRHSHALNEHSGSEGHAHEHEHHHGHHHHDHAGHAHHHAAEDDHDRQDSSPGDEVDHLHVVWFGINFALPVPTNGLPEQHDEDSQWVVLASEMQPVSSVALEMALTLLISIEPDVTSWASLEAPIRWDRHASSPPLCDAARRDRSGVLKS